jgi:hypothetical protein
MTGKLHALGVDNSGRTVLSSWAFVRVNDLLVLCTDGNHEPPSADFDAWLVRMGKHDFTKLLIHSRGGDPNSKQRLRIGEFWRNSGRPLPKTALLTDSLSARCVLTALNWILNTNDTKCLALRDLQPALAWLGYTGPESEIAAVVSSLHLALEHRRTA